MPLWLNPPNGARSSTAVALWLLKNVTPVRSWRATFMACSVSPDHTDEHRPDQVALASPMACSSSSYGMTGSAGPNCSSATIPRSAAGLRTSEGSMKLPLSASPVYSPYVSTSAPAARASSRSSAT